jgi:hypothetical protein
MGIRLIVLYYVKSMQDLNINIEKKWHGFSINVSLLVSL